MEARPVGFFVDYFAALGGTEVDGLSFFFVGVVSISLDFLTTLAFLRYGGTVKLSSGTNPSVYVECMCFFAEPPSFR